MALGEFQAHVQWLSGFADFVTLDDLLEHSPRRSGRWRVAMTFDDGYRDNVTLGLPVLERYGIPMTWFVATKFVEDRSTLPWWDLLDYVIDHARQNVKIKMEGEYRTFDLTDLAGQSRFARTIRRLFCMEEPDQTGDLRAQLESIACKWAPRPKNAFANISEVQTAAQSPWITIGGHTLNHPNMARCEDDTLHRELAVSREKLQAWTNQDVNWFAYPYGRRTHWNNATKRAVKEAGFKGAVTGFRSYVGNRGDPYEVPRICIPPAFTIARVKATVLAANSSRRLLQLRRRWLRR